MTVSPWIFFFFLLSFSLWRFVGGVCGSLVPTCDVYVTRLHGICTSYVGYMWEGRSLKEGKISMPDVKRPGAVGRREAVPYLSLSSP